MTSAKKIIGQNKDISEVTYYNCNKKGDHVKDYAKAKN